MARPVGGRLRKVFLARGESVIASVGLAVSAILLTVMAASAWWSVQKHRASTVRALERQVEGVGALLADGVELTLSQGSVSGARRLIAGAAAENGLALCRLTLGNGKIIADADPARISAGELPETWPLLAPAALMPPAADPGWVREKVVVEVPGRGKAVLEIGAAVAYSPWADWEAQAGLGIIAAGGLAALLLVYRTIRVRLRALGAIRDALAGVGAGERAIAALEVSARLGPEAGSWNTLLCEMESLRRHVTGERAVEELGSRRRGNDDLFSACDAMWQGLVLVDDKMRVKYANGAAASFLGAKREAMLASDAAALLPGPEAVEAIRGVAEGRSRRRITLEVRRRGESGDAVLRFHVRPVRREDSAAAMVVIEDVTQQRVADEARNAFVAQATHELRTPLTNIRLYVETLQDLKESDALDRAKCVNVISSEVRRLERVVSDMLSVSEIEAGSLQLAAGDVRLDVLFEELEADYRAQAQDKEIKLEFRLPPKLPVIQGDRDKLVLALHNLVGNALKYTPVGGEVTVSAEEKEGSIVVDVADNGIGISAEECELIFEKFYRSRDRRIASITGSGLGLALARNVVRLHGGDVTVRSQIDKGSTFTLSVPALAPAAAAA